MTLHVAPNLKLPDTAQTQTLVVYGGKGMGKTNFGSVLVEELAKRGLRFSVIDALDVWWGLQHGATKEAKGLDLVILGGPHGDIPIEPTAGAVVADFVADERASTVIVLRKTNGEMWTNGERIRFVTDYATRLFARQGERRIPLMQVIDEAGRFVPQMATKGDLEIAKCIGAIEQLVEWGRNVGVGVCLITQRSARMAKAVSELAECMVAFRTVGPNSISAIVDWFGEHVAKARTNELVEQLRSLDRGSALVVSPGWLGFEGVAHIRARETFDSSSTPGQGKSLRAPGQATKPDLEKYRERMAETIERATADDPKALRAKLTKLERELAAKPAPASPKVERIEVGVLGARELDRLDKTIGTMREDLDRYESRIAGRFGAVTKALSDVAAALAKVDRNGHTPKLAERAVQPVAIGRQVSNLQQRFDRVTKAKAREGEKLSPAKQKILDALAFLEGIGVGEAEKVQTAFLADASPSSSAYTNNLGALRTAGLIEYPRANVVRLTEAGRATTAADVPSSVDELHANIRSKVSPAKWKLLEQLIAAYPKPYAKEELAELAGASATSSAFTNNLGSLRSLGLIAYPAPGQVVALPVLFLEGT